jgi:hypothetical protein
LARDFSTKNLNFWGLVFFRILVWLCGYEIEEAEIFEKADGSVYELAVEKGEEERALVFDINGKLIEKKAIEASNED